MKHKLRFYYSVEGPTCGPWPGLTGVSGHLWCRVSGVPPTHSPSGHSHVVARTTPTLIHYSPLWLLHVTTRPRVKVHWWRGRRMYLMDGLTILSPTSDCETYRWQECLNRCARLKWQFHIANFHLIYKYGSQPNSTDDQHSGIDYRLNQLNLGDYRPAIFCGADHIKTFFYCQHRFENRKFRNWWSNASIDLPFAGYVLHYVRINA